MRIQILTGLFLLFHLCTFSQSYDIEICWDTIQFESPYPYLTIDTFTSNVWQTGEPIKEFFDSAYSGDKAILTDSSNFYPVGNHSYFDLFLGEFNYEGYFNYDIFIEFKHKYDTDSLRDGGFITVSYDMGKSWVNIIEDSYSWCGNPKWTNKNLYNETDTLFNGEYGFSGRSNGWISTWFGWHQCLVKGDNYYGDTMIVRFNFISDHINSGKEGWLIDDILLYSADIGGAVNSQEMNNSLRIFPNPVKSELTIELGKEFKEIDLYMLDIMGRIIHEGHYSDQSIIHLDLSKHSNGIYILYVFPDREFAGTCKVIKN